MTNKQKLHFGIKTSQQGLSYEAIVSIWQEADTIPEIEQAWLFDHMMPIGRASKDDTCLDGWTSLAALAAQTSRLRLGLLVASNANQSPAVLAKRAATLDIISGGRLEFGLGAGGTAPEPTAYGTDNFSPADLVRRLGEACEIIKRMWTEPVLDFEGKYYHLSQTYCEPKPVQKPMPPFVIGGIGEQLTLRVVARYADVWNYPGFPHGTVETFEYKNQILDGYCRELGRDPASLARSVQILFYPYEDVAQSREIVQQFIAAGATHIVLAPRPPYREGIAHWVAQEIILPCLSS